MTPLLWFKNKCIIAGGDTNQYMSAPKQVQNNLYYLTEENMGQYNFGSISLASSIGIFWRIFKIFKLEDYLIQRLWFIFIWFFSMWGMYLLIKEIAKNNFSEIGGVLGACLYMVNIFNGSLASNIQISLVFFALPFLMLVTIRAVKNPLKTNLNVLYFGMIVLFASYVLPNPGYSYIFFLFPVLYILYSLISPLSFRNTFCRLKLIIKIFLTSIISTSFLTLPYLYNTRDIFLTSQSSARGGFFSANSIQETFRFLASWAFRASHYKIPYSPWSNKYYDSPWVVFATFLIPVTVFIGFVFQKRFKKDVLFFCLVSFLGLFLSKGIGRPLGNLYQWAFDHIPLFTAFREAWSKFTQITVFSFSVLLGLGFSEIKENIHNLKLKKIIISTFSGITICCIAIAAFPIFTSSIFSAYWNGSAKGNYIKIPDYWNKTSEYLKNQGPSNIVFLTPRSKLCIYEWDMGISTMSSIPPLILYNPVIKYEENAFVSGVEMLNLVYGLIEPENSYKFSKLLKFLGVKYVLQQNDMDWRFLAPHTYSPNVMEKILKQQPGLEKIMSIGKLDIYKVSKELFLPEIYIADNTSLVYGSIEDLPKLLFTDSLDKKPLINFIDSESLNSAIYNPSLYNNILVVDGKSCSASIEPENAALVYDFIDRKSKAMDVDIPKGKYTLKLAYAPLEQKEIVPSFKDKIISPNQLESSEIKFAKINFLAPEKEMPVFSLNPILANWEYETYFYQPEEKKLVLENFNNKAINVDLCIRFEYYWKGLVRLFNWNTGGLINEGSLDNFSDFIEIKDILVEPGKNVFKVICIPTKCEKNWPGEKVNIKRDIGIRLSNCEQPLDDRACVRNKLILETDYDLTVFNGIKQIDLLCYLDSNNDSQVDGWMQITIDDWLMARDYSHFSIDLIGAMRERLNNSNYKILAIDMVFYPARGGAAEKTEDKIEGEVLLKNFSLTHIYYPIYSIYNKYLKNNFQKLNPFNTTLYTDFRQISDKDCYPIIMEVKEFMSQGGKTEINLSEDKMFDLKWLILSPEKKTDNYNKISGVVKKITKINPVMYQAQVELKEPCFIVLSKNFHPGWNAFIENIRNKNTLLNSSVLLTYFKNKLQGNQKINIHIKANGYANAWYLDSKEIEKLKNNYGQILFIYYPQIFQEAGILITFLFLISALAYITLYKIRH